MSSRLKHHILGIIALIVCITPPAATVIYFFPLWKEQSPEAALSGFCLFLLLICAVPLFKHLKDFFKNPSARMVWIVGLIVFWSIGSIAEQMKVICAVGLIANLLGGIVFKIRDRFKEEK